MPRDVFWYSPDGEVVLQAWVSFVGREEDTIPYEELHRHATPEQWERGLKALREMAAEGAGKRNGKP